MLNAADGWIPPTHGEASMELTLNPQEAELLGRLLERAMMDLRREINHTDRGAFKAALKSDEILLQGILDRLRIPASRT
jgi:hypothetical protein